MTKNNNLGIWMDHENAFLTEFTEDPMKTSSINSDFSHVQKAEAMSKSENLMHNKEQQTQTSFYKKISEEISHYTEVLIFGPTNAKQELYNLLKENHHFDNIKIEVLNSDKMNTHEQQLFVRKHFSKH